MKNFKKIALLSLFAGFIAGSTHQIFAASRSTDSSSSSSSSSGSSASEPDITTTEITCAIDPAILTDQKKLYTCLQIMHLRARTVETMYDRASHGQGQLNIIISDNRFKENLLDAKERKEHFEKTNLSFFKEAEIVYSEAPQDVQQFINYLENEATKSIKQNHNIAKYPTYFNVANIAKTKLLPSAMRKKLLFSVAGLALSNKLLDFSILYSATYPYKHYLASVYNKLVDQYKKSDILDLPKNIFAIDYAYLTLSQDDLITLVELLQQHNAQNIITILEQQVLVEKAKLKSFNKSDTKARLQAKNLLNAIDRVTESIQSFKKSFTVSAQEKAQDYFRDQYFLPNILALLTNNIYLQYNIFYSNIVGILNRIYNLDTSTVNELHFPPQAANDVFKSPETFDALLGLETIHEPKKVEPIDDSWIEQYNTPKKGPHKKQGGNQRSKGKGKKGKKTTSTPAKPAKKTHPTSSSSSSTPSSSSSSSTSPSPSSSSSTSSTSNAPTTSTTPSNEQLLPVTFEERIEQEPVTPVFMPTEEQETIKDYIETNEAHFVHLVDLERANRGGYQNSVFVYPGATRLTTNPLDGIKLSQHTHEKSLRPCDNNHAFTKLVECYGHCAKLEKVEELTDGKCKCFYSLPGRIASLAYPAQRAQEHGPNGYFEFIIIKATPESSSGICTHRFFRQGTVAFPTKSDIETLA